MDGCWALPALRVRDELDAVAELSGVCEVGQLNGAYAAPVNLLDRHVRAVREPRHDDQLVSGIPSIHVRARIRLRKTTALRLGECSVERIYILAHADENDVGAAIDDCVDGDDAVHAKGLAQHVADRQSRA